MLSFELDQEQKMLQDAIGRFAEGPMRKVYRDAEEEREIPANVLQAGWEFGLIPSALPQDYGGLGEYSVVTGALAMEAFAYGDLAITLNMAAPGLVAYPLLLAGTEAQQAVYLPRFAEDRPPHMTAALIEPHVQFDPYRLKSTAVREDDAYVLNGVKSVVPLAEGAELVLVYADEDGRTQAFLVPGDSPGLAVGPRERLMGVSALPTYALRLEGCRVPAENRLGGDQGVDFGLILNHSRVALGAMAVGLAKAAYDYARDYAKNRVQFGEPVAHRQSIAFMLAEMAIDVDAARLLVWEAAWHLDRGHDATRDAAVMKHFVDDMVVRTADRALQTLGGYGYIREFPAELWLRNARGFASFDGLAIV